MNQKLQDRYFAAAHAIQSAIAFLMGRDDFNGKPADSRFTSHKHMRTGIDMTKAEMEGLATLLMRKGVITEEEYEQAMVDGLEKEQARYTEIARKESGFVGLDFG